MNINSINYNGSLYIGYGGTINNQKLLGKVIEVSKNAFFSFNTIEIEMKGEKICINKKSFIKHLRSINLNESDLPEIERLGYDRFLTKHSKVYDSDSSNNSFLAALPNSAREAAFRKMIIAIQENNTEVAIQEIENGAFLNKSFFEVLGKIKFSKEDLYKECKNYELTYFKKSGPIPYTYRHTPLTFALTHKCEAIANTIFMLKGNVSTSDYMYMIDNISHHIEESGLRPYRRVPRHLLQNQKVKENESGLPQLAPMTDEECLSIPMQ